MDIDEVLKIFLKEFSQDFLYSFELKQRFEKLEHDGNYSSYSVDLAILRDKHTIMVISQAKDEKEEEKLFYNYQAYCPDVDYYVVVRENKFVCKERPYCKEDSEELRNPYGFGNTPSYSIIEKTEFDIEGIVDLIRYSDELLYITSKELIEYLDKQASAYGFDNLSSVIEKISDDTFGYNNHSIWLDSVTEVRLITTLLNDKEMPSSVYRYASSNILKRLFDNEEKMHSMSSLITMNDSTELDYANNYLKGNGLDIGLESLEYERNESIHAYITSLTTLKDDLTLWRLYGDEAKGVCIEYEVPEGIHSTGFIFAWVSYAEEDKKNHKLDFIASLLKTKLKGRQFVLRGWHGWQHFFKPKEYRVEKEIRLLAYVDNINFNLEGYKRKWITTKEGIFAPLLLLPFNAKDNEIVYPLSIKGIVLGSNFTEKEANKITWAYRITEEYGDCVTPNFNVGLSQIDNYR